MKRFFLIFVAVFSVSALAQDSEPMVDINAITEAAATIPDFLDDQFGALVCEADNPDASEDIITSEQTSFACLLAAVEAAGLTETLMGEGPFTVFAPTDAAFRDFFDDNADFASVEDLLADTETLSAVLTYHVVPEGMALNDIFAMTTGEAEEMVTLSTVAGQDLVVMFPENISETDEEATVSISSDGLESSDASAYVASNTISTTNGFIIPIDEVLLPPMDGM